MKPFIRDNNRISLIALFIVLAGILYGRYTLPRTDVDGYTREITYDVASYYLPLPLTFIYHDVQMKNFAVVNSLWKKYEPSPTFYQGFKLDNGNWSVTYHLGIAYLQAPFFLLGDWYARTHGYLRDGFSFPYQFALSNGMMLYILLGWFFLRKVLLNFLPDGFVGLTMLIVCFGTNYYSEAINNYLQPHATLFSLNAVFLYFLIKWHQKPTFKRSIGAGILMGLLILARPSEIVCVILALLWNVYDKASLKAKLELIRKNKQQVLIILFSSFLIFIPQFIYWYTVTGSPVFFSYQKTEGFDFLKPHLMKILFSFKKSLLVYTPMYIFIIIGLIRLRKNFAPVSLAIVTYALITFYLLGSWGAWWNDGSFGMRFFAQSHAVMSVPLGLLLFDISKRKIGVKMIATAFISFFVFLNLFQTWQYLHWIIPDNRMTFKYYKKSFLKTYVTEEDKKWMEVERTYTSADPVLKTEEYNQPALIGLYNFDDMNSTPVDPLVLDTTVKHSGKYALRMSNDVMYYPTFYIPYQQLIPEDRDHAWIKVSCWFYAGKNQENNASIVINMPHGKYHLKYRSFNLGEKTYVPDQWNYTEFLYMTPFPIDEDDKFEIYGWYHGKGEPVYIDDLKIESIIRKY